MAGTRLPPGFQFHPTDVELLKYYLKRKVTGRRFPFEAIAEVDIYKYAPWDLPDKSCLRSGNSKWYFLCPREKKGASGARMYHATEFGYWKTTGRDRPVQCNKEVVGMMKTFIFHRGKAPQGSRTDWAMQEYRLQEKDLTDREVVQDTCVLCMIYKKDGPRPRSATQYGAPFEEEVWEDDNDGDNEEVNCGGAFSVVGMSAPRVVNEFDDVFTLSDILPYTFDDVPTVSVGDVASVEAPQAVNEVDEILGLLDILPYASDVVCTGSVNNTASVEAPQVADEVDDILALSDILPYTCDAVPPYPVKNVASVKAPQIVNEDDDILALLDMFFVGDTNVLNENGKNEIFNSLNHGCKVDVGEDYCSDANDGHNPQHTLDQMLLGDNAPFLELMDLETPLNCSGEPVGSEYIQIESIYADDGDDNHPDNPFDTAQISYGLG